MSAETDEASVPRWRVIAQDPNGRTREFVLSSAAILGRDPGADICLEGRKISRRHFNVEIDDDNRLVVTDLQSHNGTLVDGRKISQAVLHGGEMLQAGEWKIRFLPDRRRSSAPQSPTPVITDDFADDDLTMDLTSPVRAQLMAEAGLNQPTSQPKGSLAWSWDQRTKSAPEKLRVVPLESNPLVQSLRSSSTGRLEVGEIGNLRMIAQELDSGPAQQSMDNLALSLLYRVMADSHGALTLEDFLGTVAEALLDVTQGQGVAVLLPDGSFGEMQPKVIKLSQRVETLQLSQTVVEAAVRDRAAVVAANASADTRFAKGESVAKLDLRAVLCVPLLRENDVEGAIYVTRERPFLPAEHDLVGALGHLVGLGIEQARLREQVQNETALRSTLERFHTPEVVEKIMLTGHRSDTGGVEPFLEPLEATVLFCDLSSFTAFSERYPPSRVANLLNAYLSRMTEVIFEHRGTVDKYIGDAVMAIFGAPFPAEDDPVRAVACALAMRSAFNAVIADRPPEERLRVRIGVNTGPVVAGLIGSKLRLEYTALGDAVNVASRLEAAAQPGQILIGPRTMDVVNGRFLIQTRGPIALKGKAEPVEVFEVVATGPIGAS